MSSDIINLCPDSVCNVNSLGQYLIYCGTTIDNPLYYNQNKKFYIGVTNNPNNHFNYHKKTRHLYNMYLLSYVNRKDNSEFIEDNLIKYYKNNPFNLNKISGGSGIDKGKNYVYIAIQ